MPGRLRTVTVFCLLFAVAISVWGGETVLIDEDFSSNPNVAQGGNWVLNGSAAWDPNEQRIVVTPAQNSQRGTIFYNELLEINNFRLEAKVKICCGSGADGMAITLIQADDLSRTTSIGDGGGGMAVTNMTTGPQIVVEFDIYGNNAACESCALDPRTGAAANHIGVEYSPTGFPPGDCIPNDANLNSGCASDEAIGFDLYDQSGSFTIDIVVQVQNATVTVDIGSEDHVPPIPLHRVITHEFVDYMPFEGLLGVTASTGGANAEQSIYSLKLTSLPAGVCITPPGKMVRTLRGSTTRMLEWQEVDAYEPGKPVDVTLEIASLREASENCAVPSELTVEENVPEGWTVSDISDGGTFADGKITWVLTGAAITQGKTLTYKATPPGDGEKPFAEFVEFSGTMTESNIAEPLSVSIEGDNQIYPADDRGIDRNGFIRTWLVLGPYMQQGGANPAEADIVRDYLTDGDQTELTILPEEGATIDTDYAGEAASDGLAAAPASAEVNPGGVPTWLAWSDATDTITFDDGDDGNDGTVPYEIYGTVDDVMAYAACYVINNTGEAILCEVGMGSDDSIQVILNGGSIWVHSIPRGPGGAGEIQDTAPAVLNPGVNRLLVKVFEGGGGFQFRLRFQNLDGTPIIEGIEITLEPPTGCPVPPVLVARSLQLPSTLDVEGIPTPAYTEGDGLEVSLSLSEVRQPGGGCEAAGDVTIVEYLPEGWTAKDISNNGTFSDGQVTWQIPAAQLAGITELSYTADGPVTGATMGIAGAVLEAGNELSFGVGGQSAFGTDYPIMASGFITTWLILGPYMQTGGSNPGVDAIRQDYLTDGDVTDLDVMPRAGEEIETDYAIAASTGLAPTGPQVNPNGVPMWVAWRDANEAIDFQNPNLYDAQDNVMAYAVCYVLVEEDMEVRFACGSDDSIGIWLDDQEVWVNSIPRGWGGGGPQDHSDPVTVTAGLHRLMVKIFEGGGDWNFGVRLEDVDQNPITTGFKVCLDPDECGAQPQGINVYMGEVNGDGAVNIADAISLLGYLFGGQAEPGCLKAADANDDGGVNIADAVTILGYLFGGQPLIAPDGAAITPASHPGCATYKKEDVEDVGCAVPCTAK